MAKLSHPQLGCIIGKLGDGIVEYLGVKYGSISGRFAASELFEGNSTDGPIDATSHGPSVVGPDGCDQEFGLIQQSLPRGNFKQSDTECLNLNVSIPQSSRKLRQLPVIVFIHGGGLEIGSSSWPQYSLSKFVRLSNDIGRPIVGVTINYRVNASGFLTSEQMRNAGLKCNNGLADQRTALLWVKQYISGFNGDPENVTVVGQSAGAVCASLLLASKEPLFKRLACLGGQFLARRPIPPAAHEQLYEAALRTLDFQDLPPHERIDALQNMTTENLLKLTPAIPSFPMLEDDVCPIKPTFATLEGGISGKLTKGWAQELFIGDCAMDGSIFSLALAHRKRGIAAAFLQSLVKSLADIPRASETIMRAYDIRETDDDDKAFTSILEFGNDIVFYVPSVMMAKAWKGPAYLYHFNEPNPWVGPWRGQSSHITDIAFLWGNYDSFLSEEQRKVATQFRTDLIYFANGNAPWGALGKDDKQQVRVYGPSTDSVAGIVADLNSPTTNRRLVIWDLMRQIGADPLLDAFNAFLEE